jgi:osmotically-inducible protein OsmY
VVILSGGVPDEHSLHRAIDLASSVKGVREVRNELEIEFPKY